MVRLHAQVHQGSRLNQISETLQIADKGAANIGFAESEVVQVVAVPSMLPGRIGGFLLHHRGTRFCRHRYSCRGINAFDGGHGVAGNFRIRDIDEAMLLLQYRTLLHIALHLSTPILKLIAAQLLRIFKIAVHLPARPGQLGNGSRRGHRVTMAMNDRGIGKSLEQWRQITQVPWSCCLNQTSKDGIRNA